MLNKIIALKKKSYLYATFHMLVVTATAFSLTGCSSTQTANKPAPQLEITAEQHAALPVNISSKIEKLKLEKERNSVINLTEIALTAIQHRYEIPKELWGNLIDQPLDLAIKRIEDVYSDTPEAKKARSLWHDEDVKEFKGEPYERSFVFLIRGARYYEKGDYDNAIACFKSGLLQDSLSTEGKFNADMAIFEWFIGVCHQKLGESAAAKEAFDRALEIRPDLKIPGKGHNTVALVLAGEAPRKEQTGKYKDILLILPGECNSEVVSISRPYFGAMPFYTATEMAEDFFFQATTRGGRSIDKINKHKAKVKDNTKVLGTAAIFVGVVVVGTGLMLVGMKSGGNMAGWIIMGVGAALVVIGVGAHLIAKAIKTKADIRTITHIPSRLFVWSDNVLPGWRNFGVKSEGEDTTNLEFEKSRINYGIPNNVVYIFCK